MLDMAVAMHKCWHFSARPVSHHRSAF